MANAKSTIYPIQLQGAELNLNKYDAEIKQYSGFNKNNSPFVGGCLSNVFKKNETIEDATSKNTYIAANGDIYQVTTEGLFKNGEKLIDTSENDFYDVEDLGTEAFPETVAYVYDEETYLYYKNKHIYYHCKNVDRDMFSDYLTFQYIDRINVDNYKYVKCNIIKKTFDNVDYDIVGVIMSDLNTNTAYRDGIVILFLSIYKKNEDGSIAEVFTQLKWGYGENHDFMFASAYKMFSLVIKTSGESLSNFKIAVLTCCPAYFTIPLTNKNNFLFTFDGVNFTYTNYFTFFENGNVRITDKLSNYYITDKELVAVQSNSSTILLNTNLKIPYTIDFSQSKINVEQLTPVEGGSVVSKPFNDFLNNWGALSVVRSGNEAEDHNVYTIDDDITTFGYYNQNADLYNKLQFNLGAILNGQVLINNKQVSGISLPGGNILVTEWNTVAGVKYIFFGDNSEEWKNNKYVCLWKGTNKKWYKLVKSTPWLKVINNNIIINVNNIKNSYNIIKNEILLFAPAWNNRRPYYKGTQSASDVVYMATSINEYNLENNASLILNPVPVNRLASSPNASLFSKYIKDKGDGVQVNIYFGETEILYKYSQINNDKFYSDEELTDLPFPSNTDGNVQYSPSLFAVQKGKYGNLIFISEGGTAYKLMTYNNKAVMSYFLATAVEGLEDFFTIQGQLYGIIDAQIYSFNIINEIASKGDFIVSVENLQFIGNTPYEALFFSKTNRCLYSFTGANVLNQKQLVDKISEVRNYLYNPTTQTVFLITDIGVLFYGLFGMFLLEYTYITNIFLLDNGIVMSDNIGNYHYIKYYLDEGETDYTKENIRLETCFYGMNNEVVTINDCLYIRLFSEEHEEGLLKVKATTISLKGRQTEETTFKIKANDWDKLTHTIYLRYQPKTQRGLGISFSVDSPFKIASMSVGSQPDAVLVDKVSKGAITAPSVTTNNNEW